MLPRKLVLIIPLLFCTLYFAGCRKKVATSAPPLPPPPAPAPTATLSANPAAIEAGGSTELTWATENATEITIEGVGTVEANGTQTTAPIESTTYRLIAKGPGGETEATARVTVTKPEAAAPAEPEIDDNAFQRAVLPIYFDYDEYGIRNDQAERIATNARFLAEHAALRFVIEGHADERGSTEYNLALGDNRANTIKAALVSAGVSDARISVVSYGKERPFCNDSNESCWKENRRAHFMLQK